MRTTLITLMLFLVFPSVASALTVPERVDTPSTDPSVTRWVRESKVPLPFTPHVVWAGCWHPGFEQLSCTTLGTNTVWMAERRRWDFYHEMGHMVDFGMEDKWRTMFAIRLDDHRAWWEGDRGQSGGKPPLDEWWADAFASCAMYGNNPPRAMASHTRTAYSWTDTAGGRPRSRTIGTSAGRCGTTFRGSARRSTCPYRKVERLGRDRRQPRISTFVQQRGCILRCIGYSQLCKPDSATQRRPTIKERHHGYCIPQSDRARLRHHHWPAPPRA